MSHRSGSNEEHHTGFIYELGDAAGPGGMGIRPEDGDIPTERVRLRRSLFAPSIG